MTPGIPQNPALVVIDTSVLIQLVCTDNLALLRTIRTNYGTQASIVPAVESEVMQLLTTPRFIGRQDQLKKALSSGAIALVDRSLIFASFGHGADALLAQIDSEGARFFLKVDRGEAYSHAAASVLGVPIATNDTSAVNRLLKDGENIPRPILRFWDLIVLAHQLGELDSGACDKVRQSLLRAKERLPFWLDGKSFDGALKSFYPRLIDAKKPCVGAPERQERLDDRLALWNL